MPPSPLLPLLRFHFAVGARLAMRALVPTITAAFGGMLLGTDFLTSFSHMLFGARSSGGSAVLVRGGVPGRGNGGGAAGLPRSRRLDAPSAGERAGPSPGRGARHRRRPGAAAPGVSRPGLLC